MANTVQRRNDILAYLGDESASSDLTKEQQADFKNKLGWGESKFDDVGYWNVDMINSIEQQVHDAKKAGDARRFATSETLKLQQDNVNSKLQQVRVNSFLGSVGVQKAAGGMK